MRGVRPDDGRQSRVTATRAGDAQSAGGLLGRWLRARRAATRPADLGVPTGPRARSTAVTQFQVARRGGISHRVYRAVENGQRLPGPRVLDGIVQGLSLNGSEETYLRRLASPSPHTCTALTTDLAAALAAVVGHHEYGYATNHRSDVIAASGALREAGITEGENLLRWLLTTPTARAALPNWQQVAADAVGAARAEQARHAHDAWYETQIPQLTARCPELDGLWHGRVHITPPQPTLTLHLRRHDNSVATLTGTRLRLEGCDCAQIVLLNKAD